MIKTDWIRKKIFILLSAGLLLAFALVTNTGAVSKEFQAAIEVLEEVTVVEDVPLNFGRIRPPRSTFESPGQYIINPNGFLGDPGGGDFGNFIDGQQIGQFTLIGPPNSSALTLDVALFPVLGAGGLMRACVEAGPGNITDKVLISPGFLWLPNPGPSLDGNGKATLLVGAEFMVAFDASGPGVCHFNINFTAS